MPYIYMFGRCVFLIFGTIAIAEAGSDMLIRTFELHTYMRPTILDILLALSFGWGCIEFSFFIARRQ